LANLEKDQGFYQGEVSLTAWGSQSSCDSFTSCNQQDKEIQALRSNTFFPYSSQEEQWV